MAKTVTEHQQEADQIKRHIDEADALVRRLRSELETCRNVLEWSIGFDNPEFERGIQYKGFKVDPDGKSSTSTLKTAAKFRVSKINELLGDRA